MAREQALNQNKYDQIVKLLSKTLSRAEMEQVSMMFVLDPSFERADICLAMKDIEQKKGW